MSRLGTPSHTHPPPSASLPRSMPAEFGSSRLPYRIGPRLHVVDGGFRSRGNNTLALRCRTRVDLVEPLPKQLCPRVECLLRICPCRISVEIVRDTLRHCRRSAL